jgi:hypothetical protein
VSFAIDDQSWFGAAMVAIGRYVVGLEKMELVKPRTAVMLLGFNGFLMYPTNLGCKEKMISIDDDDTSNVQGSMTSKELRV